MESWNVKGKDKETKKISENYNDVLKSTGQKPLQTLGLQLLKKRLWHSCFPVYFAKFLRTYFLQNTSE